jgi:exopolyphosphatase/guanosine-5'-triphosphate,3'-diphosphate pyrophosphatase
MKAVNTPVFRQGAVTLSEDVFGAGGVAETDRVVRGRRTYAAIDLGTNNCRLLVARPAREGFVIVDAFSRIVRLGEGMGATGLISPDAQRRAIDALVHCAEKLNRRHVTVARSVATEACRRAGNGPDFVARVFEETGIALDVISPAEEARLAVLGCQSLLDDADGHALIFDIGGGSTELVLLECHKGRDVRISRWVSVPWGVVSLTETEQDEQGTPMTRRAAYERMLSRISDMVADFAAETSMDCTHMQLLGTSGTVTTLASLYLDLPSYDRRKIDGCIVPSSSMREISTRLSSQSIKERAAHACIGQERADLVVAGCAILEAILDAWPAKQLKVADRGIREGILRSMMARDGHRF